jgi:hypothetical protein
MNIISTSPANNAQGVFLDQAIEVYFDKRMDMPSVHPTQVEIWTDTGNKVDWKQIRVAGKFTDQGSMLKIQTTYDWAPLTKYIVAFRGTLPKDVKADSSLIGIRGIDGSYLQPNSVSFTTGNTYKNDVFSGAPRVTMLTPGKILVSGDADAQAGVALANATTLVPDNPIYIGFSKAIKHYSVDTFGKTLSPEIPRIDVEKFPGIAVGILSSATLLSEVMKKIPSGNNVEEWKGFLDNILKQRLKGFVHSEDSRRRLVFEIDKSCGDISGCGYPKNSVASITSVVVIVISGFVSVEENLSMKSATIGGFVHIGDYKAGAGFPSVESGLGALKGVFSQ